MPNARGKTLRVAERLLAQAGCSAGTISHAYSKVVSKGLVISERPTSGTVLRTGGKVNLVVSRGRRH